MLADLVRIQEKIKKPLILPVREYSNEEVSNIEKLRTMLHQGKIETKWESFTVTLVNIDQETAVAHLEQPSSVRISREEILDFFGQEIPLGIVEYTFRDVLIRNKDEVRAKLKNYEKDKPIVVEFQAVENSGRLEILFMDWLPSETLPKEGE
jgi:hypothetical protein